MGKIFAISGCTNSGKTTLAKIVREYIGNEKVEIIHQDDFYLSADQVEKLYMTVDGKDVTQRGFFYSYDEKESLDCERFKKAIEKACEASNIVIVEGNMLTEFDEIIENCSKIIVMTLDFKTCKARRELRTYDPPDDVGYFEYVAWPAYQKHLKNAFEKSRYNNRFVFLDVSNSSVDIIKESKNILNKVLNYNLRITKNVLSIEEVQKLAASSTCGAISLFVGTTRDNFNGKKVQKLSYECYDEMVYKELHKICDLAKKEIPAIQKIVIHHRIGEVPIAEASVIIATSSPHRAESIRATELLINQLKLSVPIWKKEIYTENDHTWKNNNLINPQASSFQSNDSLNHLGKDLIEFLD